MQNNEVAEVHRKRAEAELLTLANSFDPDEPLRRSFLAAAPVLRILGGSAAGKSALRQGLASAN
jgi:hypothetical protein